MELSCYISPHGYGHATRTIAVVEALRQRIPQLAVRVFSLAPESLFRSCGPVTAFHRVTTDVGFVQDTPFTINFSATLDKLAAFIPLHEKMLRSCVAASASSTLILSDISPLGIAVSKQTGIPCVLLENFTWDWIYRDIIQQQSDFRKFADFFADYYRDADFHVQAEPICCRTDSADLHCPPIARPCRQSPEITARQLGVDKRPRVLISMGGIPFKPPFLEQLKQHAEIIFIIAGQDKDAWYDRNIRLLPADSTIAHPDLINAVDLLVCKSGYSTIAECSQTDTRICCVSRPDFAESKVLADYVVSKLGGSTLSPEQFFSGSWCHALPDMLNQAVPPRRKENGCHKIADWLSRKLHASAD